MHQRPLDGIKVIELSTYVAAPSCARILAELGARVIKIETEKGDAWREFSKSVTKTDDAENPMFDIYNMRKKSIVLNLKNQKSKEILFKLLEDTDIFVTNIRTKSLEKMNLGYDSLRDSFPRLIYAVMLGYGSRGPDAEQPGFDSSSFWCRTGFLRDFAVDTGDNYPLVQSTAMGDSVCGMTLTAGIMTALFNRTRTGKGDKVTTSLYGTGIWMVGSMVVQTQKKYGVTYPLKRSWQNAIQTSYRCADGEWIIVIIMEPVRYFESFCAALGCGHLSRDPRFSTDSARATYNAELVKILESVFKTKSSEECLQRLRNADIVCQRLNHISEIENDEQAWANDFLTKQKFRNGQEAVIPRIPILLESVPLLESEPAPSVGEHTNEILAELGYAESDT